MNRQATGSPRRTFWRSPWFPLLLLVLGVALFWVLPQQLPRTRMQIEFAPPKP